MSDGQLTNGQRAAHALDGINAHARSSARQEPGTSEERFFFDFDRDTEPGTDHARLADLLRDLQHYARRRGLDFDAALAAARRDYEVQRTTYQPGDAIRPAGRTGDAAAAGGFPLVGEIIKARPGRLPGYQVEFITRRQWIAEPELEAARASPASSPGSGKSAPPTPPAGASSRPPGRPRKHSPGAATPKPGTSGISPGSWTR